MPADQRCRQITWLVAANYAGLVRWAVYRKPLLVVGMSTLVFGLIMLGMIQRVRVFAASRTRHQFGGNHRRNLLTFNEAVHMLPNS